VTSQNVAITEHQQSLIVNPKAIRVAVAIITVELLDFMTTPALGGFDAATRQSCGSTGRRPAKLTPSPAPPPQ
jgi:hypothetical protein